MDYLEKLLNSEYVKEAMAKIGSANVLVNMVSRRVRQLNSGGNRPLIDDVGNLGLADIALLEIIHDKMSYTISSETKEAEEDQPGFKKRRR